MDKNIGTELNDSELEQATGGHHPGLICREMGGRFVNGKCLPKKK